MCFLPFKKPRDFFVLSTPRVPGGVHRALAKLTSARGGGGTKAKGTSVTLMRRKREVGESAAAGAEAEGKDAGLLTGGRT